MIYDIYAFAYATLNLIGWILWLSLLFWMFGMPGKQKDQQQTKKIPALTNNRLHNKF